MILTMFKLHLKRLIFDFRHRFMTALFVKSCHRNGIKVEKGHNCVLDHCFIKGNSGCEIVIEDNCALSYCSFCFYGKGGRIIIHDSTVVNASSGARTCLFVRGETSIEIGRCSLLAHSVDISTTDFHSVFDNDGIVMNMDQDVVIGEHVWIGKRVTINKGSVIPRDSVVGASSVVTKQFFTPNVVIAGNPAIVRKQIIGWSR